MTTGFLRPVIAWLRRVPGADATTQGNAVGLQLLLLMVGTSLPLIWPYRIAALTNPMNQADWVDLITDTLVTLSAWGGVVWVRMGYLTRATKLFVTTILLSLAAGYIERGLISSMLDQTYVVLSIVLGGLLLGRAALWRLYGILICLFSAGAAVDVARMAARGAAHPLMGAVNVLPLALSYLAITLVLDNCVSALRGSVLRAEEREQSLAAINLTLEEEIRAHQRSREQLIHAQKVEAVGRLAGGVAHDFNNILSVIEGYAEAREDSDDPAALRSALYGVAAAARRGAGVTRKLLSFGRKDTARIEVIDLKRKVRDVKHVLRQLFSHQTVLTVDVADDARFIHFDPEQLELMILNIAANARDAMPPNGTFDVRATRTDAGRVRLAFRDNGHGMTEAVRQAALEPFFTTKPPHAGSGLGLAVVRDLVHECGGTVGIDSYEGAGTTITLELPAVIAADHGEGRPMPIVHTLLVEDEDVLREMWRKRLEAEGFLVVEAGSAGSARQLAMELSHSLNLVITDLRLGDNDPSTWVGELRCLLPDAPILAVSSHFPTSVAQVTGVAILHKPCSPDALVSEAMRALDLSVIAPRQIAST